MTQRDDREQIKQLFQNMDLDGSGAIEKQELIWMMGAEGVDSFVVEVERLFEEADTNGDGKIDFEEFQALIDKL